MNKNKNKMKLFVAGAALVVTFVFGVSLMADTVTLTNNAGIVYTQTTMGEGATVVDQLYLGGAVRLTDTDADAPTTGFLTIRGTNLVFITTMKDGVAVSPTNAYVVVKAGVLVP